MEKILSIVIPSFNTEKYIVDCTATMLDPSIIDDIELLIVNDGSKDNTASLAEELVLKYPNSVRHIYKENGGHGSTINRGIKEAKGKYFRVIDGDDWVATEAFVKYVKALKEHDEDVVLTHFERVYESDKSKTKMSIYLDEGVYNFDDVCTRMGDTYQIHSVTFKTELIRKMRQIREHCFYVDQEYVLFPLPYISSAYVMDLIVYQYRIGINEQSMSEKNMIKNRKMHENVIFDLIDFYNNETLSAPKKKYLHERLTQLAARQLRILLTMDDAKLGKMECVEYIKRLIETAPDVASNMPGKKAQALRLTRGQAYNILRNR